MLLKKEWGLELKPAASSEGLCEEDWLELLPAPQIISTTNNAAITTNTMITTLVDDIGSFLSAFANTSTYPAQVVSFETFLTVIWQLAYPLLSSLMFDRPCGTVTVKYLVVAGIRFL